MVIVVIVVIDVIIMVIVIIVIILIIVVILIMFTQSFDIQHLAFKRDWTILGIEYLIGIYSGYISEVTI